MASLKSDQGFLQDLQGDSELEFSEELHIDFTLGLLYSQKAPLQNYFRRAEQLPE